MKSPHSYLTPMHGLVRPYVVLRSCSPQRLRQFAGFTFLWNLFEGIACNGSASIDTLDRVSEQLEHSPALAQNTVEQCLAFYRFRYVKDNEIQRRFYGLNFRKKDRQELVEAVLLDKEKTLHKKLLSLLIIAYRIRNDMFHGLKSVYIWGDQTRNISEAARILSVALEVLGTPVVERVRDP